MSFLTECLSYFAEEKKEKKESTLFCSDCEFYPEKWWLIFIYCDFYWSRVILFPENCHRKVYPVQSSDTWSWKHYSRWNTTRDEVDGCPSTSGENSLPQKVIIRTIVDDLVANFPSEWIRKCLAAKQSSPNDDSWRSGNVYELIFRYVFTPRQMWMAGP